jgi:hypothetical protein
MKLPISVPARKHHMIAGALLLAAALLVPLTSDYAAAAEAAKPAKPAWMTPQWTAEKAKLIEQGKQYPSAWAFYQDLKKKAGGGQRLSWDKLPDWSGVYSRPMGVGAYGLYFDLDQTGELPTAKYTPEYQARLLKTVNDLKNGIEYDPLSQCNSPTYPRWLTLPFLRDHVVTPDQTTMISEAFNTVRRIYTDGRDHIPEADRYPLELGDSIGFWDGDRLIVHTNQNMAHMYERAQGDYSDEVETVEIWRKVDDKTLQADVWVYDPPALAEPWFARQRYVKLDNPDKKIRVRHWSCKGNPNNDVVETPEGGSQFKEFTFEKKEK